jgi:hypothetical protein
MSLNGEYDLIIYLLIFDVFNNHLNRKYDINADILTLILDRLPIYLQLIVILGQNSDCSHLQIHIDLLFSPNEAKECLIRSYYNSKNPSVMIATSNVH